MIKMIKGVFGLRETKGIIYKTPGDEPFSVDEKTEARLVKDEFAVYVDGKKEQAQTNTNQNGGTTPPGGSSSQQEEEKEEFDPVAAKKLGVPVLKTLAVSYGVKAEDMVKEDGKDKTKAQIVELIEAEIKKTEEAEKVKAELAKKAEECTEDCSQCGETECAKHPNNTEEEEEEETSDLDLGSGADGVL